MDSGSLLLFYYWSHYMPSLSKDTFCWICEARFIDNDDGTYECDCGLWSEEGELIRPNRIIKKRAPLPQAIDVILGIERRRS